MVRKALHGTHPHPKSRTEYPSGTGVTLRRVICGKRLKSWIISGCHIGKRIQNLQFRCRIGAHNNEALAVSEIIFVASLFKLSWMGGIRY